MTGLDFEKAQIFDLGCRRVAGLVKFEGSGKAAGAVLGHVSNLIGI